MKIAPKKAFELEPWVSRVLSEASLQFTTSRGPGGQNVNKTQSAALLRWSLWKTSAFNRDQLGLLMIKLRSQLTKEGELVIRADEFRSQSQNEDACKERMTTLIRQALFVPKPRKKTKPKKSAVQKRLDKKGRRSEVKAGRARVKF